MAGLSSWINSKTVKAVVLPPEHGSWAYVLEPILLGCLWMTDSRCWNCGIGLFLLFLSLRPSQLALRDLRAKKRYPRTWTALCFSVILGFGGLALVLATSFADGPKTLVPTSIALGVMALGFAGSEIIRARASHDHPARLVLVLLAASVMLPLIRVQATLSLDPVKALEWSECLFVLARSIPSFLYVRCRLKGVSFGQPLAQWAALAAFLPLLPWLFNPGVLYIPYFSGGFWAYAILFVRALYGLQPHKVGTKTPKQVGLLEAAFGAAWLLVLAGWLRLLSTVPSA